jgi:hypothetical protein
MSKARFTRANASFVGIRKPGSCNVSPDTNEDGKVRKEVISIDALRTISRIVLAIQQRIAAGNDTGTGTEPCSAGTPSGSKIIGPNSDKDIN